MDGGNDSALRIEGAIVRSVARVRIAEIKRQTPLGVSLSRWFAAV